MQNNGIHITHQILNLIKLVIPQNYFTFFSKIYQPGKGVTIGSPISNTIAEIFLKYLEVKHIKYVLDTINITFNISYVEDILIYSCMTLKEYILTLSSQI